MGSVLAFEEFELDAARFELRRSGQRVAVQPKVLRLLLHLAAHRDRSVSEHELLAVLWPNETVGSASVRRAVRGARNALGERGDGESTIRTVRGHGYQFMTPVREVGRPDMPLDPDAAHESTAASGVRPIVSVSGIAPALRGGALPDSGIAPALRGGAMSAALPANARAEDASDVFVGREGVLAIVEGTFAEMLAGQGRGLLLVGEPGIGKTRTLHELARRARAHGALAWLGRCCEVEGAPAFWPVVQIVRESLRSFDPGELQALMGPGAADIAQAIPELRAWLPGLPRAQEIDSVSARFRFFDSMALFLAAVAERRPLCVLVDDVHCADEPAQRLLAFLVRELERSRVLFAFASRPAAAATLGKAPVDRLAGEAPLRSAELHGLTPCEVARYLELRVRAVAPRAVVEQLHQQTGGNPLFLEQIVHESGAQPEGGASRWERLGANPQAQGLAAAIARHLGVLSRPCRELLCAASVLGREFSASILAQTAELAADAVSALLAEATAAGVLQPSPDGARLHRFAHALIRDALYDQLPPAERARLHGRAGRMLEALGAATSDELLPRLAEHFLRAAPDDRDRALRYTLRAALAAKQRLAYEDAALQLDRALELLEGTPAEAGRRLMLLLDKAEVLCAAGQTAAARAGALQAVAIARELGAAEPLAAAAALIARSPESGSVDPIQVELLREALAALPAAAPERALLQGLLAKSLMYAREPTPCARIALAARTAALRLSPTARAETLYACHEALAAPEHWGERRSIADELAAIGHEHGDHAILLLASTVRIWNCVELGDMAGADVALTALETLAEHVRDPAARWRVRVFRAMRALVLGQLERAERLAGEARELGSPLAPDSAEHVYCVQMYGALRLQGRLAEAEPLVRAISLRHPAISGWRAVLAGLHADMGRTEQARAVLDQLMEGDADIVPPRSAGAMPPLDKLERDPFALSALAPTADLCAQVGDARLARRLYEAILPYEHHHGNVSMGIGTHGPMARHLGVLALRMGDPQRAERHLEHAIAVSEAMPSPPFVALACIAAAHVVLHDGRRAAHARAAALIARALAVARAAGLWTVARHCRDLAKRRGLNLPVHRSSSAPPRAPIARLGRDATPGAPLAAVPAPPGPAGARHRRHGVGRTS